MKNTPKCTYNKVLPLEGCFKFKEFEMRFLGIQNVSVAVTG